MRITRRVLEKIVRDTVAQRTRDNRSLMAIYLSGSLLEDDFLLGGTTDIDLVFIHADPVELEREIVYLTDEVHLDISHHLHRDYRQTRSLRTHPWLGPILFSCSVLHDPQHFLDFTQASVRGQFDRADHVFERARSFYDQAREIWFDYYHESGEPGQREVNDYLQAVGKAANAIASLTGGPLTERRFLLKFPARAEAIGRSGLYAGLLGLLGSPTVDAATIKSWLPGWESAFDALPNQNRTAGLSLERKYYYLQAFKAMVDSSQPETVLWPMLRTWTEMAGLFPPDSSGQDDWRLALGHLNILSDFDQRVKALDAYLDMVDEALDRWARSNGVLLE
jgi:hypothetical protein